jgi:trans-L-3-hydroxyproline dehydratase
MYEQGRIREGQWLDTISPRGSIFRGTVLGEARVGDHAVLHSHITGRAWALAHSQVMIDLEDPLVDISDLEHLLA